MKIFGYKKTEVNDYGLLELNEITFQGSPEQLRTIAKFLLEVAESIEMNPGKFDHDHISFNNPNWNDDYPEIVVAE